MPVTSFIAAEFTMTSNADPSLSFNGPEPSKLLRASIWLVQVLAFIAFGLVGLIKLFKPIPELAAMWPWTGQLPEAIVRTLGVIDLAGGIGVLLPSLTRIKPGLTVAAALCCVALQICAMVFHVSRGEIVATPVNVVFLALVAYVFWGRRRVVVMPR